MVTSMQEVGIKKVFIVMGDWLDDLQVPVDLTNATAFLLGNQILGIVDIVLKGIMVHLAMAYLV